MKPTHPARHCASGSRAAEECRCTCGSLLARIVEEGVELKCRRCKRVLFVPWSASEGFVSPRGVEAGVLSSPA